MAIAAGYQIQGINRDTNVAVKAIRGSISRPAQLMVGEYIAWHVWTVNVEKCLGSNLAIQGIWCLFSLPCGRQIQR